MVKKYICLCLIFQLNVLYAFDKEPLFENDKVFLYEDECEDPVQAHKRLAMLLHQIRILDGLICFIYYPFDREEALKCCKILQWRIQEFETIRKKFGFASHEEVECIKHLAMSVKIPEKPGV